MISLTLSCLYRSQDVDSIGILYSKYMCKHNYNIYNMSSMYTYFVGIGWCYPTIYCFQNSLLCNLPYYSFFLDIYFPPPFLLVTFLYEFTPFSIEANVVSISKPFASTGVYSSSIFCIPILTFFIPQSCSKPAHPYR